MLSKVLIKRAVILGLVGLVTLSLGLFGLSCSCGEKAVPETTTPPPPSTPPIPQEGVYLNPTFIELEPGQTLSIKVAVKPAGWGASGGEINLAFNPAVLEAVDVKPGPFFGKDPIVGLRRIDNQEGVIRLALARVGETAVPSPPGELATVEFVVPDSATSGTYELELTEVSLADQNFQDITGFTTQSTIIKINS